GHGFTRRPVFHAHDLPAPAIQVADDIPGVFLGRHHFDFHDRLEQDRLRLAEAILEAHRGGDLERHFVRVDVVIRAVERRDLHVHDGIARHDAGLLGFLDALLDGRNELARHRAADDAIHEDVALAGLVRLDLEPYVPVLAAATGLAHELAFRVHGAANGFAVGDLRLADVRLDLELALHAVDDDFEVQLAHAGDDRLPRFLIGRHAERGIFLREALQGQAHFLL